MLPSNIYLEYRPPLQKKTLDTLNCSNIINKDYFVFLKDFIENLLEINTTLIILLLLGSTIHLKCPIVLAPGLNRATAYPRVSKIDREIFVRFSQPRDSRPISVISLDVNKDDIISEAL